MKGRRSPFEMHFAKDGPETTKRLRIHQPFNHKDWWGRQDSHLRLPACQAKRSDRRSKRTLTRDSLKSRRKTIHTSTAKLGNSALFGLIHSQRITERRICNPPFKPRVNISPVTY